MISAAVVAAALLVPHGPTALTLARYSFAKLERINHIHNHQTIRWLVRHFDQLPPAPSGPIACPADNGDRVIASFHYRRRHADKVTVELTGCEIVSNGHVTRWAIHAPRLIHRLERLTS